MGWCTTCCAKINKKSILPFNEQLKDLDDPENELADFNKDKPLTEEEMEVRKKAAQDIDSTESIFKYWAINKTVHGYGSLSQVRICESKLTGEKKVVKILD